MKLVPDGKRSKDPGSILDYTMNWTDFCDEIGDTISTSTWVIPNVTGAPTKVSDGIDAGGKKTTIVVDGGTIGESYDITNHIVTTINHLEDEATFRLKIIDT